MFFIRYPVRDDQPQYKRASRYAASKEDIAATISSLLDARELTFEDEPSIEEAIHLWKGSSADFADCLSNARNRRLGCRTTATFDRNALQLTGFTQV
jgi:predicted nucleic-acid-binding protein